MNESQKKAVEMIMIAYALSQLEAIAYVKANQNIMKAVEKRQNFIDMKKAGYEPEGDFVKLEEDLFKAVAEDVSEESADNDLMRIVGPLDQKTCEKCREWHDKTVSISGRDSRYPSWNDFIKHIHPNCRHSFQPLTVKEIPRKHLRSANQETPLTKLVFN